MRLLTPDADIKMTVIELFWSSRNSGNVVPLLRLIIHESL
jgi:hypothetical protein